MYLAANMLEPPDCTLQEAVRSCNLSRYARRNFTGSEIRRQVTLEFSFVFVSGLDH